ncbi:MAG TPA: hypothetical protein VMF69_10475 [Gemmataceae bacterium]|nr:hypothetical protein [Gemmataceae bacterium]
MSMPSYPVSCYTRGCEELAVYKIAARWSDGVTQELKTYALTCSACLADSFRRSRDKQAVCRLAAGETLESPGIYELTRGRRDPQLVRRADLEQQLLSASEPPP